MPIYEYFCSDCRNLFEAIRSMSEADEQINCPECDSVHTSRQITLFYAKSDGRTIAGSEVNCTNCHSKACSSCGA